MENNTRFSKNYTIKKSSNKKEETNFKEEYSISIRQHLKQSKTSPIEAVITYLKDSSSRVILREGL